jgi:hypothetical protein
MRLLPGSFVAVTALMLASCEGGKPAVNAVNVRANTLALCDGATVSVGGGEALQRLFLQQVGPSSAIVKWRYNDKSTTPASLCFGTDPNALPASSLQTSTIGETNQHEVHLSGLQPDIQYYYSVGGGMVANPQHGFRTAQHTTASPADGNIRMWILGDPGTAGYQDSANQVSVRDAYHL